MNSISLLQEHVVGSFLQHPKYDIVDETSATFGSKFTCICTCGSQKTTATSKSKKDAKHKAADMMVECMGLTSQLQREDTLQTAPNSETEFNAIGKLNEYCSKNQYEYATYKFIGQSGSLFTIQCVHQLLEASGQGSNKKQAKQNAAIEMLKLLKQNPQVRKEPYESPTPTQWNVISASDEDVIERYRNLSLDYKTKHEQTRSLQVIDSTESIVQSPKSTAQKSTVDADAVNQALRDKLHDVGVQYSIKTMPSKDEGAITMIFTSNNLNATGASSGNVTTILAMGETRAAVINKLLVEALERLEV